MAQRPAEPCQDRNGTRKRRPKSWEEGGPSLTHSPVIVFGMEPDMIRDGSTIPIARIFQDLLKKSMMMLPLGAADDGEHSQNEKINRWVEPGVSRLFLGC